MSTVASHTDHGHAPDGHDNGHGHGLPFLAHHFDSPEQQFASAKLGMWVFLGTEILMFGGLFCAYTVYRHNHPEIFLFAAEKYLSTFWGAFNTCVLIASSFTMAWAVRLVQINKIKPAVICMVLTFLGGIGFMVVKGIEYNHKWHDFVFVGPYENQYHKNFNPTDKQKEQLAEVKAEEAAREKTAGTGIAHHEAATVVEKPDNYIDPNTGTPDAAKLLANFNQVTGLAAAQKHTSHVPEFKDMRKLDQDRVASFFGIYFVMTGLHGLHVLIGMGLIAWVAIKTMANQFGPVYYTPVEIVGLYWHLVDLIWIFLFPLLYLIH